MHTTNVSSVHTTENLSKKNAGQEYCMHQPANEIAIVSHLGFDILANIQPVISEEGDRRRISIYLHQAILDYFTGKNYQARIHGVLVRYVQLKARMQGNLFYTSNVVVSDWNEARLRDKLIWAFLENMYASASPDRPRKKKITISISESIIDHFKSEYNRGWQSRINSVLFAYVIANNRNDSGRPKAMMPLNPELKDKYVKYVFGSEAIKVKKPGLQNELNFIENSFEPLLRNYRVLQDISDRFVCPHCCQSIYTNGVFHDPQGCSFNPNRFDARNTFLQINCGRCGEPAMKKQGSEFMIHDSSRCNFTLGKSSRPLKYVSIEKADASAQCILGFMYVQGDGVEQNYKKAREFFELSAGQGNEGAFYNLGVMYVQGDGVEQNYKKAREYFELSALRGDANAAYNLGVMYFTGDGTEREFEKAVYHFSKSAEQGDSVALYYLGEMYNSGIGVEKDNESAIQCFRQAAEMGNSQAQFRLGVIYSLGSGVDEDGSKALGFFHAAAMQGNPDASYVLGFIFAGGYLSESDYERAIEYFRLASEQGHANAQYQLGKMYYEGRGVEQDYRKAVKFYGMAADLGLSEAIEALDGLISKSKSVE